MCVTKILIKHTVDSETVVTPLNQKIILPVFPPATSYWIQSP